MVYRVGNQEYMEDSKDKFVRLRLISLEKLDYQVEGGRLMIKLPKSYEIHFGPGPGDKNGIDSMEWKDIWEEEPPRNEEILFMTGDDVIHWGVILDTKKLKECKFRSFSSQRYFECNIETPSDKRVSHWLPLPKKPKKGFVWTQYHSPH